MRREPDIKRARWQLWAATFAIMGALAGAVILLTSAEEPFTSPTFLPSRLLLAFGLAGIVAAFGLYAVDRERHLQNLQNKLTEERYEAEQLAERLHFLTALTRERDMNAALLDASADGIAVVGTDGRIVRFNETMARLTGVDPDVAMGMAVEDVLLIGGHADDSTHPVRAAVGDGEARVGLELRLAHTDGSEQWVSATLSPVHDREGEGPALVLVTLRNIEEQKEQERTQRDFVSMAAHELRSPLTAIKGFARTLLTKADRLDEQKRTRYLDMIDEQSNRLARLVDDLMQVARIDAGRVVLDIEPVDTLTVARQVLDQYRQKWGDRAIEVRSSNGHTAALADPHRLEEILINLIDNAVKYSPSAAPVVVTIDAADSLQVSVRDRGIGIPPEQIPDLFKKFSRLSSDATADIPGTGLGLYIVKGLIEAQGGNVWVESEPGEGSTFRFTLPRAQVDVATGTDGR